MTRQRGGATLVIVGAIVCVGIVGMAYARSVSQQAQRSTTLLAGQSSGIWPAGWTTYTPQAQSETNSGIIVFADLTPPATGAPSAALATREAASQWLDLPADELGTTFVADLLPLLASDDPETRWMATGTIHVLAISAYERPEAEVRAAELRASEEIREALLANAEYYEFIRVNPYSEGLQITSREVREAALDSIGVLYDGAPEFEALLERMYETETDEDVLRAVIDMITVHQYTSASMEAILEELSEDIDPELASNAAYALEILLGRR